MPLGYLWRPFQVVVWNRRSRPRCDAPAGARAGGRVLTVWNPEDRAFWQSTGRAVATRNLWISIPALFLSFAVWMVWSVVVVRLPAIGFPYTTDQLFWLAALPGLSGATLRIFYSFMVPDLRRAALDGALAPPRCSSRRSASASRCRTRPRPYGTMLVLALLCGFGGGNFASSMANISFFFPKEQKGTALGLNAGLGNLGVSAMQFVVPLVITAGVFGGLGGAPQTVAKTGELALAAERRLRLGAVHRRGDRSRRGSA